ncbi:MAG: P-loop NTPase [Acidimicrobiales bacterium]|nr:P-loop NTPase [Acidimicrobiales bacterium]
MSLSSFFGRGDPGANGNGAPPGGGMAVETPLPPAPEANGHGAPDTADGGGYGGYDPLPPLTPEPAAPPAPPAPSAGGYAPAPAAPVSNLPAPSLSHIAIAVVDADQTIRTRLAQQLGETAAPFPSVDALAQRLNGTPVVTVLGPSCAYGSELAALEQLLQRHPEVGAILIAAEMSTTLLQQALRAGVKDVLAIPLDGNQLVQTVQRVADALSSQAAALVPRAPEFTGPEPLAPTENGQVITVFSTKGGSGKSVIASNVAVRLAMRSDKPVCLVDADLQFGDVAVMLKLAPQHTIVDAVGAIDRLDAGLLQGFLVSHEPSGLLVLPAPLEPAFADQIGGPEMVTIVETLRSFCSHVVIDTPAYFNDVVLNLIEVSDDVLLVAGMDIPNIKNVKIGLQTLRLLNTPMSKLRLVLNRANSKVKLEVGEVEKTLQVKADSLIPSDVVVPQAVNKGTPVILSAPKAAVSRALEQLADTFVVAPAGRR